jgi:hypothetical protein
MRAPYSAAWGLLLVSLGPWLVAANGCRLGREAPTGAVDGKSSGTSPVSAATAQWHWPGARGQSGVNGDPDHKRSSVEAFCTWRGKPCPVAHTYTQRQTWQTMSTEAGTGWTFDNFAGFPGLLVISQGLVPEGKSDPRADLAACATGAHDDTFRAFGELMVKKGRAASVVRLGWEFNGDFMPWSAWNTEQWKSCYRHAALALRAANPRVILDWTINAHGTPEGICNGRSTNCYPGDDVVDIIGIDNYDIAPSASSRADFMRIAKAPDGLSWIHAFAKKRGKKLSVGEWGIAPGSSYNTTGENPEFIRWMHEWLSAHAGDLAYEAYFTDCSPKLVESNLMRPPGGDCVRVNSKAAQLYRALWGAP